MRRFWWVLIPGTLLISLGILKFVRSAPSQTRRVLEKNHLSALEHQEKGKWDLAIEEFKKDLILNPAKAETHLQIAIIYDDYLNRRDEAEKHYKAYLKMAPNEEKSVLVRKWLRRAKNQNKQDLEQGVEKPFLKSEISVKGDIKSSPDSTLRKELLNLQELNNNLKSKISEQSITLQAHQARMAEKEKKLSELNHQIESYKAQKTSQDQTQVDVENIKKSRELLEKDLLQTKNAWAEANKQVADLRFNREELKKRNQILESEKAALEKKLSDREAAGSEQRAVEFKYQKYLDSLKENEDLKRKKTLQDAKEIRLKAALASIEAANENLKKQLKTYQETPARSYRPQVIVYKKYKVRKGESLRTIAILFYGDKDKWRLIYNANRSNIRDPDILTAGQILDIPTNS